MQGLPEYRHRVEIIVEGNEPTDHLMKIMLTAYFQLRRVGDFTEIHEGPVYRDGAMRFSGTLQTTCPPHDLREAEVLIRLTNSQRVET